MLTWHKITAARRSINRQYIFITPNAIEGRNTLDKDVKIIRYVQGSVDVRLPLKLTLSLGSLILGRRRWLTIDTPVTPRVFVFVLISFACSSPLYSHL